MQDRFVVTAKLAWRIREQGLDLSPNSRYATERLKEIATRWHELFTELNALDRELKALAEKEE